MNSCYVRKCTNVVFFGIDNSLLFTKVPTVYECVCVCVCVYLKPGYLCLGFGGRMNVSFNKI